MNTPYDRVPVAEDADPLAWQNKALCAQTDAESFFPEKGGSTRDAKRVCVSCEVKQECLEYALAIDERFGIWGGLSERERRRLKRKAPTPSTRTTIAETSQAKPQEDDVPIAVRIEQVLRYLGDNRGSVTSTATDIGRAIDLPRPVAAVAIMHIMVQQGLIDWTPKSRYPVLIKLLPAGENRVWSAA